MAPARAESPDRIAVLGAASPAGGHLRAALADRGIPGRRVELFGHGSEVAVLSEYDGEARIVQSAAGLDAADFAAVFVCEPGHDAGALSAAASAGRLIVDLSGTIDGATLLGDPSADSAGCLVCVPHPVTLLLEPPLAALHRQLGVIAASAFVMRPASDFGEPGLEELREQTIHLLRFEATPTEVFGRQLAFSVIPEHLFPSGEEHAARRIARESRTLLGAAELRFAVSLALVPTFLGHAIALHVDLARGGAAEARSALAAAPGLDLADGPDTGTTLDAPEEPGLTVARLDEAGRGTVRVWLLGAEPGAIAAARAVAAASDSGVLVNVS